MNNLQITQHPMNTKYKIQKCVPYQKCPVCNGTGKEPVNSTAMTIVCTICHGMKIIPMYMIAEEVIADTEDLLSTSKACKMLGVSRTTLWRMETAGEVAPVMVGNAKKYRIEELRNKVRKVV